MHIWHTVSYCVPVKPTENATWVFVWVDSLYVSANKSKDTKTKCEKPKDST